MAIRSAAGGRLAGLRAAGQDQRAEKTVGLNEASGARAERGLQVNEAASRRQDEIFQAEKQDRIRGNVGRAYETASWGDQAGAIAAYNEGRAKDQHIDGIEVGDNGDLFVSRRGDQARIKLARIERWLPKNPNAVKAGSRITANTPGARMKIGQGINQFDKNYDTKKAKQDPATKKAIEDAMLTYDPNTDGPIDEYQANVARDLGIDPAGSEGIVNELQAKDQEIADMQESMRAGGFFYGPEFSVKGTKFPVNPLAKDRSFKLRELQQERKILARELEMANPVVRARQNKIRLEERKIVKAHPGFDSNNDGRIDEQDKMFQVAQLVVETLAIPDDSEDPNIAIKKKKFRDRYSPKRLIEFEALVKAVTKKATADAETKVGLREPKKTASPAAAPANKARGNIQGLQFQNR